jgi:hypothetical protein
VRNCSVYGGEKQESFGLVLRRISTIRRHRCAARQLARREHRGRALATSPQSSVMLVVAPAEPLGYVTVAYPAIRKELR